MLVLRAIRSCIQRCWWLFWPRTWRSWGPNTNNSSGPIGQQTLCGVVTKLSIPHMLVEIKFTVRLDLPKDHTAITNGMSSEVEAGYAQIVKCGSTVEVSGQFDHNDEGKMRGGGDFDAQCEQAFKNIDKRLAEIGATRNQIVHTEVLIANIRNNFEKLNAAHKKFFGSYRPASACWGVVALGMPGAQVEIKFTVRPNLSKAPKTYPHGLPWEDAHNYSQVVVTNETAWIFGQFAQDDEGNAIGESDFEKQCKAAFANLDMCLAAIGATRSQIVHAGAMVVGLSDNATKLSAAHKKILWCVPTGQHDLGRHSSRLALHDGGDLCHCLSTRQRSLRTG
ncbi:hypothetical protein PPTG_05836 [Phytophthora nicotianae INRA-310]|uniref:Uncharacterized protein n=1 Tax=Phytophthora nicotianae (strain INRA-310) TaxID=761204 RepID=W2QU02_PHYN3|nr:hypothetical protein PPTG_05836 [Phytophthora nicotianae INRA-310]ETN16682.1 hypothetical protein PPTG_05836 [Phytophthora nicotianae INRA-310]